MDIELIIQSVMGLVALLSLLLFLLFTTSKSKSSIKKIIKKDSKTSFKTDLESLRQIVRDKKSQTELLRETLELIIKYHGTIHPKLGIRAHPDFDPYMDILFTICRHPNADKEMIIYFDKALCKINNEYKKEINEAITKGLTSRRV